MVGHMMGAAGAVESIACIKAIQDGTIPPTINYETPDPECDLDYTVNQARKRKVDVAMTNSFGLGGHNSCVVFRKYPTEGGGRKAEGGRGMSGSAFHPPASALRPPPYAS